MLRLTIEGSTVQELHNQLEQMYTHMVSDVKNNCECCDQPDCPKNEILHELPDIMKTALGSPQEATEVVPEEEPTPVSEAAQEGHDEPQSTNAEEAPSPEKVRAVLNDLRKCKGTAVVKEILKAHGAENFPSLNSGCYAIVIKEAMRYATD